MTLTIRILSIATLLLFASCSGGQDEPSPEASGPDPAAEDIDRASIIKQAVFTDLEGNEVTLETYRGKVLVIDFWETWCAPCLQVFPSLQELREEFPDDFEVLAVTLGAMEGPEEAIGFRDEHNYDFQFLYDANNVSDELGIFSIPFKLYIDPDGELIKSEIGTRGREGDYSNTREIIQEYSSL
ncbi:MAG: TlpA family protein disulfide reductase [Bacteroidota bacterium]